MLYNIKKHRKVFLYFMVRPVGIEPTLQVPETCALSTELRAHMLLMHNT